MGILDQFKDYVPDFSLSQVVHTGTIAIIVIVCSGIVGVVLAFFLLKLRFNKKIVIFEKINNRYERTGTDLARDFKIGLAGDTIILLKKRKKYLTNPKIQNGRRTYWYAIREDGEWINFGIEDLNEKTREMGIKFSDEDMKHSRSALQRNLRDRYDKPSFLQKYGGMLAYATLILVTCVGAWLIADKFLLIVDKVGYQIELANQLATTQREILGALDNVCSTSGLISAG